jgi:short-subunit dehydrogenase
MPLPPSSPTAAAASAAPSSARSSPAASPSGIHAASSSDRAGRLAHRLAMDPDVVAASALAGLRRGQRVIIPGALNRLHHLVTRLLPAALAARLFAWIGRSDPAARSSTPV